MRQRREEGLNREEDMEVGGGEQLVTSKSRPQKCSGRLGTGEGKGQGVPTKRSEPTGNGKPF